MPGCLGTWARSLSFYSYDLQSTVNNMESRQRVRKGVDSGSRPPLSPGSTFEEVHREISGNVDC
ncbi:uncharacterized protein RAG0_02291 [Rhynchosporium agropyri]|uniref:Uncharacterized protein n=1 Tax=Rhynchosporium agropyri TaxID=914238 RepID=A0A1E1K5A9_9HELO|nr:uncharacterized protein RAG0_02291 [Rhynchosporium agropyri]